MTSLTIIVSAYNRASCLNLLLKSLAALKCSQNIDLVISIDNKGTKEVNELAHMFNWHLGDKKVIIHEEKKGLINHFIWVGDQTQIYEHVLFLEDDMYVSPQILNFALQAIPKYENDDRVAGCSLYNPPFTLSGLIFDKLPDSYDNFFYQHPYWGNIWFKNKWAKFKDYLTTYKLNETILPIAVQKWKSGSFKRIFIQYLIETGRTMVFPRDSVLTNMGTPGLHGGGNVDFVQVPIEPTQVSREFRLSSIDESLARYDAFEEIDVAIIKKFNKKLSDYDFLIDTKLNRNYYDSEFILTTRSVNNSIQTYSMSLKPYENNVIMQYQGTGISFCRLNDLVENNRDRSRLIWHTVRSHCPVDNKKYIPFEIERVLKVILHKIFRIENK